MANINNAAWTDADFHTAVALGKIPWARRIFFSGNNPDIDPGSEPEDIHPPGGLFAFKTAGGRLEVVATSANDSAAGTGMRTLVISGLNANYSEISETVTLNGTTAVGTVRTDWFRINTAVGATFGTNQRNVDAISIRDFGAGTVRGTIGTFIEGTSTLQGSSVLDQMLYTVPAGYTMLVDSIDFQVNRAGAARSATARIYARSSTGALRSQKTLSADSTATYTLSGKMPVPIAEKTDFWVRVINVSGTNTDVSSTAEAVLVNNAYLSSF